MVSGGWLGGGGDVGGGEEVIVWESGWWYLGRVIVGDRWWWEVGCGEKKKDRISILMLKWSKWIYLKFIKKLIIEYKNQKNDTAHHQHT